MFILCRAHDITPMCLKLKSKSGQEARSMYVLIVLDEVGEEMTRKCVSDVAEEQTLWHYDASISITPDVICS